MTDEHPPNIIPGKEPAYVSRGALKLEHAFNVFGPQYGLSPDGRICADMGCSTGGFTDSMLRRGAQRVYSIDTAYGILDYRLRIDERVTVMERTNALHADPPGPLELPSLIAVDMSWTLQVKCVPAALRWLSESGDSRIVTLVKPHYESKPLGLDASMERGVLPESDAKEVMARVVKSLPALGVRVLDVTKSPIAGGKKGAKSRKGQGNTEYLALLARA